MQLYINEHIHNSEHREEIERVWELMKDKFSFDVDMYVHFENWPRWRILFRTVTNIIGWKYCQEISCTTEMLKDDLWIDHFVKTINRKIAIDLMKSDVFKELIFFVNQFSGVVDFNDVKPYFDSLKFRLIKTEIGV